MVRHKGLRMALRLEMNQMIEISTGTDIDR